MQIGMYRQDTQFIFRHIAINFAMNECHRMPAMPKDVSPDPCAKHMCLLRCTVQSAGLHNRTVSYMVCVLCSY